MPGMDKEIIQSKWLTKRNYNMDNERWTWIQDGGSLYVSLIGENKEIMVAYRT